MKRSPATRMPSQQQIDPHLLAIEINALRVAEIATLRRECEFWRERCRLLEAVAESDGRVVAAAAV